MLGFSKVKVIFLIGALFLLAAGCGTGAKQDVSQKEAPSPKVETNTSGEPAKDSALESELTWYANIQKPAAEAIAKAFKEKTGVNIVLKRTGGSEVMIRLKAWQCLIKSLL
ncbi:MAG: hypothetical protein RO469_04345 [Thermincola sp.]|jgi:ABC-type glycerol-3-phosphate transport system substrate-binding protein|nr:hypothetical protein [Thermincola sp.]MDT3704177.1 hypothetical protein [Thermincola sp.]